MSVEELAKELYEMSDSRMYMWDFNTLKNEDVAGYKKYILLAKHVQRKIIEARINELNYITGVLGFIPVDLGGEVEQLYKRLATLQSQLEEMK